MKKFKLTRVLALVLSLALLIGAVFCINISAEESTGPKDGQFAGIKGAYGDKVYILVEVYATQEQIENGEVVVSYMLDGKEAKATYYEGEASKKAGYVFVMTEGIAAYDLAKVLTFSSTANGEQVESGRTYSVAQFLYKKLYVDNDATAEWKNLYRALLAYGEAAQVVHGDEENDFVTRSTIAYTEDSNIKFNGKKFAFAPAAGLELTPTWNGTVPAGKEVQGWKIQHYNGDEEIIKTVTFTYPGEDIEGPYVVKVLEPIFGIKDVPPYTLANGAFDNGLEGWTLEGNIGGIDNKTTFWGEGYAMNNVGNYFSAYADGAAEASHGTLTSSYFTVGSDYATYMLGGTSNHNTYITIENKAGEVLGLYRNTEFKDFPIGFEGDRYAEIGKTVFLANFVTYKVDLSDWMGQEVRFVVHDYASENWGVVFFDEVITYYTETDALPENAVEAKNLLADKSALLAELALEVTEQGDYTENSFNTYRTQFEAAKALVNDIAVTQETVDNAVAALTEARLALTVRPVEEIVGATKSFKLILGNSLNLDVADYVNANGLSNITYAVKVGETDVTVTDGKFTIAPDAVGTHTVTIITSYNGEAKLTVELTVEVTNDIVPTLNGDTFEKVVDVYGKTSLVIDLSENVSNLGDLDLSYTVNGDAANTLYNYTLGTYTDEVTYNELTVTVSYVANGEEGTLTYTYKLGLKDTTANRLANGGFENGMDGWTVVGNIGSVSNETSYWNGDFGMDGSGMFSAYAPGATEAAVGTLTSSTFKVGGSGYVTFKVGAMRDDNYVWIDVVDAETKQILARYYNGLWERDVTHCTLVAYKADLSAFIGREVFFHISDNADSDYGLFFLDSFNTYYETEPDGFNVATPVNYTVSGTIYDIFNGGFEYGDNKGWWNNGEPGAVTGADAFFSGVAYGKDGNFLYSGVEDHGAGNGREGNMGTLTSSVFQISGNGYITYMLGGGNAFCYVQVIDSTTGEVLARYRQQARNDAVLVKYVADLSAYIGRTVRIQLVDNATSDWGCVSFDNVVTYYNTIPDGLAAVDVKYEIVNGSFETGNLDGWKQNIVEAGAHNTLGWVESSEHDAGWYTKNDGRKDGNNLFTFCRPDGTNCENTKGNLISSTFTLKQNSYVSFRFGGAGTRDVHVQLVKADGTVIATFYNEAAGKVNTEMYAYYYQYTGDTTDCFFRVVDNSTSNYGCFVVDDFRVNLESAPEGFLAAIQ